MSRVLLSSGLVRGSGVGGLARLLVGLVLLGGMLVVAAPASADYRISGMFAGGGPGQGGSGSDPGQLSDPGQADVLGSSGALYVADTANHRVQVFTPNSSVADYSFQAAVPSPTGLAIDQSDGSVYVATASGIAKLNSDLTPAAGWTDPGLTGVLTLAVDPTDGDLLVADRDAGLIRRFDSDGTAGSTFAAARPLDLAVDSTGEVFVVTSTGDIYDPGCASSAVERFDSSGLPGMPFPTLNAPGSVAVDPDDDSVVVATKVNGYYCGTTATLPQVAMFTNAGVAGATLSFPDANYADVPGLAVAGGGSSRIYAITKSPFDNMFGPTMGIAMRNYTPPTATVAGTTDVTATGAEVHGSADPQGLQTYARLEYRRKGVGAAWTPTPLADQDIGSGSASVDISDQITGLAPGRVYQARVVATNDDGSATSTVMEFSTLVEAPVAQTRSVSDLTSTAVRLRGTVDPRGAATTYHFEYGTSTAYGTQVPLTPRGVDPSGSSSVSQLIAGLQPGTTYHYRVVVASSVGTAYGADLTFVTPTGDPEERVYEQVSPSEKHNLEVSVEVTFASGDSSQAAASAFASADGSRFVYAARGVYADSESGSLVANNYSARRTATGWVNQSYALKGQASVNGYAGGAGVMGWADDLGRGVYGTFATQPALVAGQTPGVSNVFRFDTADKRFVVATPDPDLGEAGGDQSIRYMGGSADLSTVVYQDTVRRAASAPPGPFTQSVYAWHDDRPGVVDVVSVLPDPDGAGPSVGEPAPDGATVPPGPNTVSDDGSKIYFSTPDGRLYVRVDAQRTIEVSASQKVTPDAAQPATFGTATVDGSKVFFTTAEQLVDGDSDADADLYRYDIVTGHLDRLAGGAERVLGTSDDGSYVYYQAGYVRLWHDGQVRDVGGPFDPVPLESVRVSADGTGIVFLGANGVNFYDADADELHCASCRPDGGQATSSLAQAAQPGGIRIMADALKGNPQRSITSNGDRVFFTSSDPLVGGDVNNRADAYEFYDGQPHLVSSGRSTSNTYFLDASADGRDVFFGTRERLVASDGDDIFDVYDARVGGGLPADVPKAPCEGEGCQGAFSGVAVGPVIGTVSLADGADAAAGRGTVSVARSVTGSSARLRVTVSGKGRIAVSGSAIKQSARSVGGAGTYTLALGLTAKAKKSLAKRKSLKTTVKVAFTPPDGRPATKLVALSFKQPKAKHKAGR